MHPFSPEWQPASTTPSDRDLEICVLDYDGIVRTFPLACHKDGPNWVDARANAAVEATLRAIREKDGRFQITESLPKVRRFSLKRSATYVLTPLNSNRIEIWDGKTATRYRKCTGVDPKPRPSEVI
jgi:hypothetical protein